MDREFGSALWFCVWGGWGEYVKFVCLFEGCMCFVYIYVCFIYVLYVYIYINIRYDNLL